ncbi:MAG: hypothetical protein KJO07_12715 [Deltaproteobacteria bacterium]|nr:hypothetical protein [Deltaproteobacteria bacterium]
MTKRKSKKRDERHMMSRRSLIKWTLAAGAAFGVSRSRVYDVLEKTAGKQVAYAAEDGTAGYLISIHAGNGGLANFQLLWPQVDVAEAANPASAWHNPSGTRRVDGTDKPLIVSDTTPWTNLGPRRQVSCFMAGNNQTHTPNRTFSVGGSPLSSVLAAMQTSRSSVIPAIGVGDVGSTNGVAGAPALAGVASPDGIVSLFNSAASREGGILASSEDAEMYKAHYDALASLNRGANRSTTRSAYGTAKGAASFLGSNLADVLAITAADEARYGVDGNMPDSIRQMARSFIVGVKAFKLGLTNALFLPGMRDDPHGMFENGNGRALNTAINLTKVLNGLMDDLVEAQDGSGKSLADQTTIVIHGDTPKDPNVREGWPDGTPGGSNWTYVYGAGYLKTGWFGSVDRNGNALGFDPASGSDAALDRATVGDAAGAAIAYAVSRGDSRRVAEFVGNINIEGIINPALL